MKIYEKQEPITHWIYAGPFTLDVCHLYHDNYHVPEQPYLFLIEEAKAKMSGVNDYPSEGKRLKLYGQEKQWNLMRLNKEEKKVTWAGFGNYARMMATFVYNNIYVDDNKTYRFKLWVAGSIIVRINGQEVFSHIRLGRVEGNFTFEANLRKGLNHCQILLINVHLHCTNSFALDFEDDSCCINVPLITSDPRLRESIERDFKRLYLKSTLFKDDEDILVCTDEPLENKGMFRFSLVKNVYKECTEDILLFKKNIFPDFESRREVVICNAAQLDSCGTYYILIDYIDSNGERIKGIRLPFEKVKFMDGLVKGNYQQRKSFILEKYALLPAGHTKTSYQGIYQEFAKLEAGKYNDFNPEVVRDVINYINKRYDCADFALHGLIRIYHRYNGSEVLPAGLKEEMKQCILNFKYWEDEPGRSMMFTRSENHEMLFFSAEYLAGLLFPMEQFTSSNQNGLFHIVKGRSRAERWIREKGSYGFMEWHSNTYYEEDMVALLNIYDLGEDNSYVRIMAKSLLDLICMLIATHSYKGVMGSTHGRCYEKYLMYPETESMSHINWVLFSQPEQLVEKISIGSVLLSGSNYQVNSVFERIAYSGKEIYTLTRMGLFPHKGLGGVNCATFRTKDYMVSGLVESNKGEFGHQVNAGQVLMDGNVPVFATCFDSKSETTRPSYWGGQYRIPKTIVYKNVLAYIYNIDTVAGYSHCYFPFRQFDAVEQKGKWLFGKKKDAYIALYSLKPYIKVSNGAYKDRELLCMEKKNIWLIEMGNKEKWNNFEDFINAVTGARLHEEGEELTYHSPSVGIIELGWERYCKIDGEPIRQKDFPLIHNDYAHGEYGSGITYMDLDGQQLILNFNI